jgi:hypothetical protein
MAHPAPARLVLDSEPDRAARLLPPEVAAAALAHAREAIARAAATCTAAELIREESAQLRQERRRIRRPPTR